VPNAYPCLTHAFWLARLCLGAAVAALVACGGGDSSSGEARPDIQRSALGIPAEPGIPSRIVKWISGLFQPNALHANLCAAPRSGTDPHSGKPYPDKMGRTLDENHWLRSWTHDNYLWYDEVEDLNPENHATPEYFALLKTKKLTPSGAPKDQFHFFLPSAEWNGLSLAGEHPGYGVRWVMRQASPPRELRVAYTEADSPASAPGALMARGARILAVNSIDLVNETQPERLAELARALQPSKAGTRTEFTVLDTGASVPRTVILESAQVMTSPVHNVKTLEGPNGRRVGYLQFNDHIRTAEPQLAQAMETLRQEGATELVVDLRYNGGGYVYLASQLAYMIAGEKNSRGKVFERAIFNDKIEASGRGFPPLPFLATGSGNALPTGVPLPSLDLRRVYLLTGADTCSASESLINGLQGIDIEVVKIGATTCGKPYGFFPEENCGNTYFSIQLKSENAKGFGDYADGIAPTCSVPDDFEHALGDAREARLGAALAYMATQTCPAPMDPAAAQRYTSLTQAGALPLLRYPQGMRERIVQAR